MPNERLPICGLKFFCRRHPWNDGVDVWLKSIDRQARRIAYAEPIVLKEYPEGTDGMLLSPLITLDQTQAQRLMDELWGCGLRPSEGTGSAGAMAATEKHLEDMRTLVFRKRGKAE
jgi:hypothetical protein